MKEYISPPNRANKMTYTENIFHCTPDIEIHAMSWGDMNKPIMLALHGWLDNAASFYRLAPLIDHYRIIAIDLPGHGHSSPLQSSFDYIMPNQLTWLHDLVQQLAKPTISLLGHSMGAGIASLYAACFPETIDLFITLDMLGPLSRDPNKTTYGLKQSVLSMRKSKRVKQDYTDINAMIQRRSKVNKVSPADIDPMVRRGIVQSESGYRWSFDSRLLLESPTYFTEQQIHDVLSHITCPCLAIMAYPNHDHRFQRIIDQRLSLLPDVTEYKIDASHHLQLSHPDEAAAIINEWLASHI